MTEPPIHVRPGGLRRRCRVHTTADEITHRSSQVYPACQAQLELGPSPSRAQDKVPRLVALDWHAVRLYRLADYLHRRGRVSAAFVVSALSRVFTGVEIEPGARFARGLVIHHGHGIVVTRHARVGRDCHLFQQVTLGVDWHGAPGGPVLGDRVLVFAGAKILGPVTVGNDAIIGANAVVLHDVPAGATAVGVPARIISG